MEVMTLRGEGLGRGEALVEIIWVAPETFLGTDLVRGEREGGGEVEGGS